MVTEEARYLSALRERLSIKLISGTAVGEGKKKLVLFSGRYLLLWNRKSAVTVRSRPTLFLLQSR